MAIHHPINIIKFVDFVQIRDGAINDLLGKNFADSGFHVTLESNGMQQDARRRPDRRSN